jgi:hypothetical protein
VVWGEEEFWATTREIVMVKKTVMIIPTMSVVSFFFMVILTNYILKNLVSWAG